MQTEEDARAADLKRRLDSGEAVCDDVYSRDWTGDRWQRVASEWVAHRVVLVLRWLELARFSHEHYAVAYYRIAKVLERALTVHVRLYRWLYQWLFRKRIERRQESKRAAQQEWDRAQLAAFRAQREANWRAEHE